MRESQYDIGVGSTNEMKRNEVLIDDFVIQNLYHGIPPPRPRRRS
jgi:hypothetical protein